MRLREEEIFQMLANRQISKEEAITLLERLNNSGQQTDEWAEEAPHAGFPDEDAISRKITGIVNSILHIMEDEINLEASFKELGVDSISSVEIVRDINKEFQLNLDAVVLYDFPTIPALSRFVSEEVGKNRKALEGVIGEKTQVAAESGILSSEYNNFAGEIQDGIINIVMDILHLSEDEISLEASFKELGVDSISSVEIVREVNKAFDLNLDAVILYDYSNITLLSAYVAKEYEKGRHVLESVSIKEVPMKELILPDKHIPEETIPQEPPAVDKGAGEIIVKNVSGIKNIQPAQQGSKIRLAPVGAACAKDSDHQTEALVQQVQAAPQITIPEETPRVSVVKSGTVEHEKDTVAIIGMSGRFPGARNVKEFWNNLKGGVDSITEIPKDRWDIDAYYDPDMKAHNKTYCRAGGYIDDADKFDTLFFNISPLEAEMMDPQQRLFLEEAWKALEDAGYSDKSLSNIRCGVFVGATQGDYEKFLEGAGYDKTAEAFSGMSPSILAARISYFLNLTGPSIAIDTACSSSLVAIHQACGSILSNESDMALAGGVRLMFTPHLHIQSSKMEILSPSGRCRTFDRDADGIVISEGVGVLVLKSLRKALQDRDHIYGVVKASGINQDGKTNGITAPSAQSQTRLELEVYRRAGINPERISFIEAHGTGTKLGDPIEVKALKEAFREYTQRKHFCALGSVKTNIGHTTTAAGVASVIKLLLALKYKVIPPSLHFKNPNEHINFEDSPFFVNTEPIEWRTSPGIPRLGAVSSFGFSGTNCHVLIEEAPV
jgi:polyketide synthase PksL